MHPILRSHRAGSRHSVYSSNMGMLHAGEGAKSVVPPLLDADERLMDSLLKPRGIKRSGLARIITTAGDDPDAPARGRGEPCSQSEEIPASRKRAAHLNQGALKGNSARLASVSIAHRTFLELPPSGYGRYVVSARGRDERAFTR